MTKEEILKRVKKFQGANREFSQELPPIIEGLVDLIDEAGPEVVDNLESNDPDKALSANMGKELNVSKMDAPSVTGEAGQILQLDEEGNPEWVEAAAVGATYDSVVSDTSTNAIQNKTIKKYVDDNFAQKNGYYASLTAGAAENLVGRGSVPAEIAFRTSGGDQDLGTGSALITKILGRTEAWNQLAQAQDTHTSATTGLTITKNDDGSVTVNGTSTGYGALQSHSNVDTIAGHKYIVLVNASAFTAGLQVYSNIGASTSYSANTIITETSAKNAVLSLRCPSSDIVFNNVKAWLILIDLTLEYGSGNEPSTVEQFRALHPLPYYNYNAGVLKNNAATSLQTVGFNAWDEEWEVGTLDGQGAPTAGTTTIRTKYYIPVIGGATYYVKVGQTWAQVYAYDQNFNYLAVWGSDSTNPITLPSAARFIKIRTSTAYGTTYNHDICINLSWSGYRNGEYEPYEKHTLNLGLDNLACHDEDDNAVVVNGLDGVGTSQDELVVENGWGTRIIKRRGRRAYQAGDESDATLMTDGTNTDYPLPTPKVLTLDNPIPASYYVNDFGTEARLPQDTADDPQAPFCAEIQYAMNSVDTLRRLPSQYISDESMTNILTALKTAGIIANFTLTYDSEHQYFTCSITAPSQGE